MLSGNRAVCRKVRPFYRGAVHRFLLSARLRAAEVCVTWGNEVTLIRQELRISNLWMLEKPFEPTYPQFGITYKQFDRKTVAHYRQGVF